MSRSHFLKHIKSLSEEELKEELKLLYGKFKDVKKYYSMELGDISARNKIYIKAKKDISNLFLIRGLHRKRPRIQKLNKLFSELKKNAVFQHELIDVYLHSAEHGMRFIIETRKSPDPVFNHTIKCLESAFKLIKESVMLDQFKDRIDGIERMSSSLYFIHKKVIGLKTEYLKG